jgi:peptidyl-prolyl cis-trans isomerase C
MPRGQLVPALDRAAAALQPGELSAPIETEAGWHLIKLEGRIPASAQALAAVAEGIRQQLVQQRGRQVLAREVAALRERSSVELLQPQ